MIVVDFPEPAFRIKKENGRPYIFDALRRRWLQLSPEEWVRQNFIRYLIEVKHYPSSLIAQEKEIRLGELRKRFDILIYDRDHRPWMMIECKEMNVTLSDAAFHQVLRYNISVPVKYIIVTNGKLTFGWRKGKEGVFLLEEIPFFPV